MDNVLIASSTPEEHRQHHKLVFDRLRQFEAIVNPTKCLEYVKFPFWGIISTAKEHIPTEGQSQSDPRVSTTTYKM